MATHLILETGRGFTIASYGGGAAFFLEDERTGETAWLQGDAADDFRENYDAWQGGLADLIRPYVGG